MRRVSAILALGLLRQSALPKCIRLPVLAALLLCAAGCSSTNISNRDPFYDYVGKTVELRRPAVLVSRHGIWSGGDGVMSRRSAKYGLVDAGSRGPYGEVYAELPI